MEQGVRQGLFIAIEGVDGSGKASQAKLLAERLEKAGYDVWRLDFPRYQKPSSYSVRRYLQGHYGHLESVSPYVASLFYAIDRFDARREIQNALDDGKIVICDRYSGSSMAHQGSKFATAEERRGFFIWLDNFEFQTMGLPRPDRSFVLRMPAEQARQHIVDKPEAADLHESHDSHLEQTVGVYDELCELFPKDFTRVDTMRSGALMSLDMISDHLWKLVEPLLPDLPVVEEDVQISPVKPDIKHSHNPSDLAPIKIKSCSSLALTMLRQRAGVAVAVQPPNVNREALFVPANLKGAVLSTYQTKLGDMYDVYGQLMTGLVSHMTQNTSTPSAKRDAAWVGNIHQEAIAVANAVLPLATTSIVGISATESATETLIDRLSTCHLKEVRSLAKEIAHDTGTLPKKTSKNTSIDSLTRKYLEESYDTPGNFIEISDYSPRNELSLLVDMVYSHSSMPTDKLQEALQKWPIARKTEVFNEYISTKLEDPGNRVLQNATYTWNILCSAQLLQQLQELDIELSWQQFTPRYGYEVPQIVEDAGLSDLYESCFDISLEVYSALQSNDHGEDAQYATLMGHRVRCQLRCTAHQLFKLHKLADDASRSPELQQIIKTLLEQIQAVHPLMGAQIIDSR